MSQNATKKKKKIPEQGQWLLRCILCRGRQLSAESVTDTLSQKHTKHTEKQQRNQKQQILYLVLYLCFQTLRWEIRIPKSVQ